MARFAFAGTCSTCKKTCGLLPCLPSCIQVPTKISRELLHHKPLRMGSRASTITPELNALMAARQVTSNIPTGSRSPTHEAGSGVASNPPCEARVYVPPCFTVAGASLPLVTIPVQVPVYEPAQSPHGATQLHMCLRRGKPVSSRTMAGQPGIRSSCVPGKRLPPSSATTINSRSTHDNQQASCYNSVAACRPPCPVSKAQLPCALMAPGNVQLYRDTAAAAGGF